MGIDGAMDSPKTLASEVMLFCPLAWLSVGVGLCPKERSPDGGKGSSVHKAGRDAVISLTCLLLGKSQERLATKRSMRLFNSLPCAMQAVSEREALNYNDGPFVGIPGIKPVD